MAESFAREKMMNSDGFARFGNLNKGYGLGSVNTRGRKDDRPRFFATRGQIFCYRPQSFVTRGQSVHYQWQFCKSRFHRWVIGFGWLRTEA